MIIKSTLLRIELVFIKVQLLFFILNYFIYKYMFIPNEYFNLTKETSTFIICGILTFSLLYKFFYRFIKSLYTNDKYRKISIVILALGFFITGLLFTNHLDLAQFNLVSINSPSEIMNTPSEAFYKINDYKVNRNICLTNYQLLYSRRNTDIYVKNYFLFPLMDKSSTASETRIWLGFNFSTEVNNRILTRGDVETNIKNAHKKNYSDMAKYNFNDIKYFYKIEFSKDYEYFENALHDSKYSRNMREKIILTASLDDLDEKRMNAFIYTLISIFVTNMLLQFFSLMFLTTEN